MTVSENLRISGLKATLPRQQILALFEQSGGKHLTADEIYRTLQQNGSAVGVGTIYRVLQQLVDAVILVRNHRDTSSATFELHEGTGHCHLVCTVCHATDEFEDAAWVARLEQLALSRGFKVDTRAPALNGVCTACLARPTPTRLRQLR